MKKVTITAIITFFAITGTSAWAENVNIKIHSVFASSEYSVEVVYEVDKPAFVECFGKDKDGNIIAHGNDIAKTAKKGTVSFAIGSKTSLIKSAECQAEVKNWSH